jgi:hypothetical protein
VQWDIDFRMDGAVTDKGRYGKSQYALGDAVVPTSHPGVPFAM